MSDVGWLAVAFGAVWIVIGLYLATIHSRQRDLERRIQQLPQKDQQAS